MAAFSNLADVLWYLGYANQAESNSLRGLAIARAADHPFTSAAGLDFAARRCQFYRNSRATQEQAEAAIAVCEEYGFAYRLALATMLRGWARAEQGHPDEGIAQIQQGLSTCHTMGTQLSLSYYLTLLAEAYSKESQVEQAVID